MCVHMQAENHPVTSSNLLDEVNRQAACIQNWHAAKVITSWSPDVVLGSGVEHLVKQDQMREHVRNAS